MRLLPVESKMLAMIGYNKDTEVLVTQFNHGSGLYKYRDVPEGVFVSVITAESQGVAFDQLVKRGGYHFEKIGPEDVLTL